MNKFLLIVIATLTVLAIIGWVTPLSTTLTIYADRLFTIAENVGVIMMLVNGTFISTLYFKIAIGLIAIIVLGVLMKILHLPGADQTLLIPFLLLFITYSIHFLKKNPKTYLDLLKVLMLAFFLVLAPLWILHFVSYNAKGILLLVSHFIFWITFVVFIVVGQRQKLFFKE